MRGCCIDVARALRERIDDVNERTENGVTALMLAARAATCCTKRILAMLLMRGADINATDDDGFTPLMVAIIWAAHDDDALELAQLLVSHGADVCKAIVDGRTARDHCLMAGYARTAHFLVQPDVLVRLV